MNKYIKLKLKRIEAANKSLGYIRRTEVQWLIDMCLELGNDLTEALKKIESMEDLKEPWTLECQGCGYTLTLMHRLGRRLGCDAPCPKCGSHNILISVKRLDGSVEER